MLSKKKEALGSLLHIHIYDKNARQEDINECFLRIEQFENTYSRFKKNNYLWKLNHRWKAPANDEIISLLNLCKAVHISTQWYFDVTLLPLLENTGYGIEEWRLQEKIGSENIEITPSEIFLHDKVMIDLGALGKWYMLDICSEMLQRNGYKKYTLNFGWDIRICGNETIGLEDPLREGKLIGQIRLSDTSFAASSGNKRQFSWKHHIFDAKTKDAQNDKIAVFTTHALGTLADIYSTALFACPLEISLQVLEKTQWLEALIIWSDGKMYTSQGFNKYLTLY